MMFREHPVQQREPPRLQPLLPEQPRVFDRDGGFAGENAHHLLVVGVEHAVLGLCATITAIARSYSTSGTPQKQPDLRSGCSPCA